MQENLVITKIDEVTGVAEIILIRTDVLNSINLESERRAFKSACKTRDFKEGIRAFVERKAMGFKGM